MKKDQEKGNRWLEFANAVIWTIVMGINLKNGALEFILEGPGQERVLGLTCLVVLGLLWYRFLAYNKRKRS